MDNFSEYLFEIFSEKIQYYYECHLEMGRGHHLRLRDERGKLIGQSQESWNKTIYQWFRHTMSMEDIIAHIGYIIYEMYSKFEDWEETVAEIVSDEREFAMKSQSSFSLALLEQIQTKYPTLDWHPTLCFFSDPFGGDGMPKLHYKLISGNRSYSSVQWFQSTAEWDAYNIDLPASAMNKGSASTGNIQPALSSYGGQTKGIIPTGYPSFFTVLDDIAAFSERHLLSVRCEKELPASKQWKRFIKHYKT